MNVGRNSSEPSPWPPACLVSGPLPEELTRVLERSWVGGVEGEAGKG